MTSPSTLAHPDSERAETYLRLRAEAELRTAVDLPRYKPPRQPRLPGWLGGGSGRVRRRILRSVAMRRMNTATASAGTPGGPARRAVGARPPVRRLAARAGQPLRSEWNQLVFALWRGQRLLLLRFVRVHKPPPARDCLHRVGTLACVLTGAGVIEDGTAAAVIEDFRAALAARSLIDPRELLRDPCGGRWPVQSSPAGPLTVFSVGVAVDGEIEGEPARFYLNSVILDQRQVSIGVTALFPRTLLMHMGPGIPPAIKALQQCTATDDTGASYRLHFGGGGGGGGGGGTWEGTLDVQHALPPGVRWLDVTLPGAQSARVSLTHQPATLPNTSVRLPADEAVERYIDHLTFSLLRRDGPAELGSAASDLAAAGLMASDNPALGRLAAAAQYAGLDMPSDLAAIRPSSLPADWLAMLARRDSHDGPAGAIPLAAELPEIEGTRCYVVGLVSEPDSATLHVHARGWPQPLHLATLQLEPFRWTARDDLGCSYAADNYGSSHSNGRADLRLRLRPAIDPRARDLQIILTGRTEQVSVTVSLDWQEGP